jgi:hypothetical protein
MGTGDKIKGKVKEAVGSGSGASPAAITSERESCVMSFPFIASDALKR